MPVDNTDHLINECRQIEEDCLYTAEAHYILAAGAGKVSLWVKLIPALAAAASGTALLLGLPSWIAWFSVISGVAFALQSIMNPDKKQEEHSHVAKSYTALKHESRSLHQTFYREMDRQSLLIEVRILRERYNMIAKMAPETTERAFEAGSKIIKSGRHIPDFKEQESEFE